jgi:hypothetical protein
MDQEFLPLCADDREQTQAILIRVIGVYQRRFFITEHT